MTAMLTHKKKCACHGQSGACSVQTCWVEAEDMKTIGQRIRKSVTIQSFQSRGISLWEC